MVKERERERKGPNHTWMFYYRLTIVWNRTSFSFICKSDAYDTMTAAAAGVYRAFVTVACIICAFARERFNYGKALANTACSGCECDVRHACLDVWLTYDIRIRDYLSQITVILSMHKYILIWNVRAMLSFFASVSSQSIRPPYPASWS